MFFVFKGTIIRRIDVFIKLLYRSFAKYGWNTINHLLSKVLIRGQKSQDWLRLCGAKIGEGSYLACGIDAFQEPYMISIGNKVYVAGGVVFMTHDGALSWVSRAMGHTDKRTDKIGYIVVKDNCFIGAKAIIMQNVTIGKNCIVGMGAVVTKDVPDNSVVAGVPAKVICTTDQYLEKHKNCRDYTCGWPYDKKRAYYEAKFEDVNGIH